MRMKEKVQVKSGILWKLNGNHCTAWLEIFILYSKTGKYIKFDPKNSLEPFHESLHRIHVDNILPCTIITIKFCLIASTKTQG